MTNLLRVFAVFAMVSLPGGRVYAQSPNTAAVTVTVADQSGAAVTDAQVMIANDTGLTREVTTGSDGVVTVAALPLIGVYGVAISKEGYSTEGVTNIQLRAGETATVRVRLMPAGGTSEVAVYGTAQGVRTDPEIGTRLAGTQIDEIPLLGRKISSLPLMDSAFRSAKGTGDVFLGSSLFVTGAGGRRQADFVVDGATGDEPWGRQAMFSTLPVGAVQEMNIMPRAFSAEFGWTSSAAINIVTKSGSNTMRGEALVLGRPGGPQSSSLSTDAHCPSSISSCVPPVTAGVTAPILAPNAPDSLLMGSFAIGGAITPDRTHYFVAGGFHASESDGGHYHADRAGRDDDHRPLPPGACQRTARSPAARDGNADGAAESGSSPPIPTRRTSCRATCCRAPGANSRGARAVCSSTTRRSFRRAWSTRRGSNCRTPARSRPSIQ